MSIDVSIKTCSSCDLPSFPFGKPALQLEVKNLRQTTVKQDMQNVGTYNKKSSKTNMEGHRRVLGHHHHLESAQSLKQL